ncbi:putative membrane protein [Leptolyngbya sp. PCC 7375]|nr:putative membrane protein [Leptolyngbya sp. PCC 7375]
MGWIIVDIYQGINNFYSGWIWWNLFLAFIPMLLSFKLFRRKALSPFWFALACFGTALIGIVGLESRLPRLRRFASSIVRDIQTGDPGTLLQLLWLAGVMVIALGISIWLFKQSHTRKLWLWWIGLVTFIAFLPNAPYVLTDILHLIRGTSAGTIKIWVVAFIFIPMHMAAIIIGFEAYVIALLNVNFYLQQKGLQALAGPVEVSIHALCAFGVYLGRFIRLNSWDIVVDPSSVLAITLNTLTSKRPLVVIFFSFVLLMVLYWIMKQVTLGLKLRIHYAQMGQNALD